MKEAIDILKEKFKAAIISSHAMCGDETVVVDVKRSHEILFFLREAEALSFNVLMDLCGVDWRGDAERFEVVYHLYSIRNKKRLRVKVRLNGDEPKIASVTDIWKAANWFEREAFDLFGIVFEGHPGLKRILMYEGFEGHPLRKDYPKDRRQKIPETDKLL